MHDMPDGFAIATDPARVDLDTLHAFLTRSYWAEGIPKEMVRKSVEGAI